MRGADIQQDTLFSTVILGQRAPADHPLRPIWQMVNTALQELNEKFSALYPDPGRALITPDEQLRAPVDGADQLQSSVSLVHGFFDGRRAWNHSTLTKNRNRLLEGVVAHRFFAAVLSQAKCAALFSKERSAWTVR